MDGCDGKMPKVTCFFLQIWARVLCTAVLYRFLLCVVKVGAGGWNKPGWWKKFKSKVICFVLRTTESVILIYADPLTTLE